MSIKPGTIMEATYGGFAALRSLRAFDFAGDISEGDRVLVLEVHDAGALNDVGDLIWSRPGLVGRVLWKSLIVYVYLCEFEGDHRRFRPL